jgi:hypothetical protein
MCFVARGAAPDFWSGILNVLSDRGSMSGGKGREAKVYTELSGGGEVSEMTTQQTTICRFGR